MDTDKKNPIEEPADRSCDSKTWSGSCQNSNLSAQQEHSDPTTDHQYQCNSCGKVHSLNHEIHHEHFPHLSGDESEMH